MTIVLLTVCAAWAAGPDLPEDFVVLAHRGVVSETITENSLPALEAAIARGYTHMEVDLRCTKDGHAVCLHDSSLLRTTGVDKRIQDITIAELRALVSEELVPSFATFCKIAEGRIELMPDIKKGPRNLVPAFAASLQTSMNKHGLADGAYFIGSREVMSEMDIRGRVSVGPVANPERVEPTDGNDSWRRFIFGRAGEFTAENVAAYRALGVPVIAGINTFHYPEGDRITPGIRDVRAMLELGVDGVQIDSVYDEPLFGPAEE